MKTNDEYFRDWESEFFGYGYGTGESHTIPNIQGFLRLCSGQNGSYSYQEAEAILGPIATWFVINALCHADIIEYGSSPRYGFLTRPGQELRDFVMTKTAGELVAITDYDPYEAYAHCSRNFCNCGETSITAHGCRNNPFWTARGKS